MTTAILAGRPAGRLLKSCISASTPPADAPMTMTSRGRHPELIMVNRHANHLLPARDPEMLSLRLSFECEPPARESAEAERLPLPFGSATHSHRCALARVRPASPHAGTGRSPTTACVPVVLPWLASDCRANRHARPCR